MAGSRRKRLGVTAGVLAGAVFATGIGLWATDSGPFKDAYCWGAWQQNSGPHLLGDEAVDESGAERRATESAPPSAGRPQGTCTVEVASDDDEDKVTVTYGPLPAAADKRQEWITHYLHGSVSFLPDGLDGLVGGDRGMLVLPEACDVDGRPSVVTMHNENWSEGREGRVTGGMGVIGTRAEVAELLLAVADTGMRAAGCAPKEPLRATSPMATVAEDREDADNPVCRIPGVVFDLPKQSRYRQQVGVVGDRLQTCSVAWLTESFDEEPAAQYVMASAPRLAALFTGLPEGPDKGLVRVECQGRETVFYGSTRLGLTGIAKPSAERVFTNFVDSVGKRIGCKADGGTA
ncbi:hypothetical protein QFZ82_005593 [Streptomyces sp. V4I23]|uniref:hypothetical protein n=1 Tax=Streptomyces sp. V4I23 TaxID=3042282 RepID=UPI0027852B47|nr:hypothetical protein [Streptomyces sp. V4I23]MDQ1011108.1 hypothetical protein [Streptomyces sp. V4I23]